MNTNFEGKTYTLTQEAYLDDRTINSWNYEHCYFASVVDQDGKEFEAVWEIKNFDPSEDDGENHDVDWDNATFVY